jgi:hypothetical protein
MGWLKSKIERGKRGNRRGKARRGESKIRSKIKSKKEPEWGVLAADDFAGLRPI